MGVSALNSHMKSQKHSELRKHQLDAAANTSQQSLRQFNFTPSPSSTVVPSSASEAASEVQGITPAAPQATTTMTSGGRNTIVAFVTEDVVTKAEIVWSLKAIMSHYSFNTSAFRARAAVLQDCRL